MHTRQEQAAQFETKMRMKASSRLLFADLATAQALIAPVRQSGAWGPETTPFPTAGIEANQWTMAATLGLDDWKLVEGSILGVRRLAGIRAEAEAAQRAFHSDELADYERIGAWIDTTLEALEELRR